MSGSAGAEHLEPPNWESIDPAASITLVVGWRSGTKMKLGRLVLAKALGEVVGHVVEDLADRQPETWTPDADLSDETYLMLAADDVGAHPILAKDVPRDTLLAALRDGAGLPALAAADLPAAELAFYAIVVGQDPDGRTVFVRRSNPRRGLRHGKWFTSYAEALVRVDAPIFAFDELVDLIYVEDKLIVLSQTAFMALFRDNAALAAQVPQWITDIAQHVPIAPGGDEILANLAQRNSRIRTRLEAIARRGHLATVTADQLASAMTEVGLDPTSYLHGGALVVEEANAHALLQFLNEDLFVGGLSAEGFRADRKSAR
jgi:hypothetical protein